MIDTVDRTTEDGLVGEIDRDALVAHIDALADLRRYPGTDDQWEAAEYIVDELSEEGIEVELQTIEAYTSVPVSASVTVTSPVREEFDDAITTAFSASTPRAVSAANSSPWSRSATARLTSPTSPGRSPSRRGCPRRGPCGRSTRPQRVRPFSSRRPRANCTR
ncbi:hypothetical protein [Halolamina pelagica]|uniref:hypothetical protein n=1 Tax=Halolamina pelagica TaxID=699431 RepID=UPI0006CA9BBD|nr:hypothetical protein [Halolamina pelagica]